MFTQSSKPQKARIQLQPVTLAIALRSSWFDVYLISGYGWPGQQVWFKSWSATLGEALTAGELVASRDRLQVVRWACLESANDQAPSELFLKGDRGSFVNAIAQYIYSLPERRKARFLKALENPQPLPRNGYTSTQTPVVPGPQAPSSPTANRLAPRLDRDSSVQAAIPHAGRSPIRKRPCPKPARRNG